MRRALLLAALLLGSGLGAGVQTVAAAPAMIYLHVPMHDVVQNVVHGVLERLQEMAPPLPDLTVLAVEPIERSESSGYGWREDPIRKRRKFHHGTDYRGKRGTPILSAGDGVVVFAGRRGGYGKVVFVDHGNGVVTRYAHMRRISTKVGATVTAGDKLGELGSTGRTTGPHLHFEVRLDGRSVDPNTALVVAELMRENPPAGQLAAMALAPEVQSRVQDSTRKRRERASRPEREGVPKRQRALW